MKKVLIIAHDFHNKEIISSIRIHGLANYLSEFGWQPIIITSDSYQQKNFGNFKVINIPYFNRKLSRYNNNCKKYGIIYRVINRLWDELIAQPYDYSIDWLYSVLDQYKLKLLNEKYDAIISTSPPETAHLIAYNLKKYFNIPWIADLRDLWTQNHYYGYFYFRKVKERKLEKKILTNADALITVSDPLVEKLKNLHPEKTIYCIPNGFDPENVNYNKNFTKKFSIVYTGKLLSGIFKKYQNPEPFFKAIRELIDNNLLDPKLLSIDFYGTSPKWLFKLITKYKLNKIVIIHGPISRNDSIMKQREAQILLLLTWDNHQEKGVLTGKIFDYFAARRPILSVGYYGGIVAEILKRTQTGVHCSSLEEIKFEILNYYKEYLSNGYVIFSGIQSEIENYSHREMALKFVRVLNYLNEKNIPI